MTDSAIYFKALELENVHCFGRRQYLDFTDENGRPAQWVLILGENNIGKTTLLKCLAWMRPVPRKNEQGLLESIYPALYDEDENLVLSSLIRVGKEVKTVLKAEFGVGRKIGQKASNQEDVPISTCIRMLGREGRLDELQPSDSELPNSQRIRRFLSSDIPIFAYGATRLPGTVKQDLEKLSDPLDSLFDNSAKFLDVDYILQQLDYRAEKFRNKQDKVRLRRVKDILATVLPDLRSADDIEILPSQGLGEPSDRGGVHFHVPTAIEPVPLSGVSLGYQIITTWILDLVLRLYKRYPDSSEPLSEPGIALIDELDLHLHPRWQREIMDYLADCFPAIQFVATAHSPLIAQAAKSAKLIVLRELDGEVIIDDQGWQVNSWRADQILASDLFGIPTRSKEIEALRRERDELLDKDQRDSVEEEQLKSLQIRLDSLETANDPEDQAAMDLIRRVAAKLQESDPQAS